MTHQTLAEWLGWLEHTRPEHEIELGLDRIRTVAEKLNLLSPAPQVITVGGTNGKGSTVALLESILLKAGYKVGVYTSPHLLRFNERVRINATEASDDTLCASFAKVNEARGNTWLTYFEFAVLVAVDCFQQAKVDVALMEVGLGGRLDATNVVEPDISVITTVGLDHQDWLGYSIEAIAREKAGIMRPEKPAIYGHSEVPQSVLQQAIKLESALHRRGSEFDIELQGDRWQWHGKSVTGESVRLTDLPLPDLVLDNAATALQALQFLPKPPSCEQVREGLASVKLAGRCQKITVENERGEAVELILDVAHNPQAAEYLVARLQEQPVAGKTRVLMAMYSDKDYVSVTEVLGQVADQWLVTELDSPRALSAEQLKAVLERQDCQVTITENVESGYRELLQASGKDDRILVTGSFMTVAAMMNVLDN